MSQNSATRPSATVAKSIQCVNGPISSDLDADIAYHRLAEMSQTATNKEIPRSAD